MNYEKISAIIKNEIDKFAKEYHNQISNDAMLKLNKKILDQIADLFEEKKYKIVSDFDGNDDMQIVSSSENDALHEALELLGYSLFFDKDCTDPTFNEKCKDKNCELHFCPKCEENWMNHNDDGSCIKD